MPPDLPGSLRLQRSFYSKSVIFYPRSAPALKSINGIVTFNKYHGSSTANYLNYVRYR